MLDLSYAGCNVTPCVDRRGSVQKVCVNRLRRMQNANAPGYALCNEKRALVTRNAVESDYYRL